jgi:hypothetical protein
MVVITGTIRHMFIQVFIGIHRFMIRSIGILMDYGLFHPAFIMADLDMVTGMDMVTDMD